MRQKACQRPNIVDLKENQWQGAVVGKVHTNREAMTKLKEKVKELEERIVEEGIERLEEEIKMSAAKRRKPRVALTLGAEGTSAKSDVYLAPRKHRSGRIFVGGREERQSIFEKNPDFVVANSTKWERHVIHRLQLDI